MHSYGPGHLGVVNKKEEKSRERKGFISSSFPSTLNLSISFREPQDEIKSRQQSHHFLIRKHLKHSSSFILQMQSLNCFWFLCLSFWVGPSLSSTSSPWPWCSLPFYTATARTTNHLRMGVAEPAALAPWPSGRSGSRAKTGRLTHKATLGLAPLCPARNGLPRALRFPCIPPAVRAQKNQVAI